MSFEHRLRVRYAETDQMGVVHHANYFVYLEEARTAYMAALGCSYRELEERGVGLPVRTAQLRCRAPAFFDDELLVSVSIGRVRAASVTFEYVVLRPADGLQIATAAVELACVGLDSSRAPKLLVPELKAALEAAGAGQGTSR